MDFGWTDEQLAFHETVVAFGQKLNAGLPEREVAGTFPHDLWQACAEFGIHGLPFPEERGGMGADLLTTMFAMEGLGYGCKDHGLLFSIHAHMWSVAMPILSFGSDEQKARFLPGLIGGTLIGAHGMSEPDSGSDAFSLRTRADQREDRYVLNGTKMFVTNAPVADVFVVFASVNRDQGMWGVTAFVIERDTPGLTIGKPIGKMGLRTSPMAELVFEDCEVSQEARLGREGQGSQIFSHSMGWERSCILATDVGAMQRQLETTVEYAKTRRQFGKSIGSFQLVASKVVDMKLALETSRLLLYRAAWSQAQGRESGLEGALAKLHISEASVQAALDALQVHGGYGYMNEFEIERELRNMIGGRLYSGTSEIQRLIIARHLGLSPR
jgi:alkylation response protein AidB-like acyl-CoA dehydrogenase